MIITILLSPLLACWCMTQFIFFINQEKLQQFTKLESQHLRAVFPKNHDFRALSWRRFGAVAPTYTSQESTVTLVRDTHRVCVLMCHELRYLAQAGLQRSRVYVIPEGFTISFLLGGRIVPSSGLVSPRAAKSALKIDGVSRRIWISWYFQSGNMEKDTAHDLGKRPQQCGGQKISGDTNSWTASRALPCTSLEEKHVKCQELVLWWYVFCNKSLPV